MQSISEEKRAIGPTLSQEGPDPVTPPSLAKQAVECTSGDAGPTPCSTQGERTQKESSTEVCHGGDMDSGLKLRAEVELETGCVESRLTSLHFVSSRCWSSALAWLEQAPLLCVSASLLHFSRFCHLLHSTLPSSTLPLCILALSSVKGPFMILAGADSS